MALSETTIHARICDHLKLHYPEAVFKSFKEDGRKRHVTDQKLFKRMHSGPGFPDIFVFEPRAGYHGLGIEVKRDGVTIKKKDGNLVADKQIRIEALMHHTLGTRGYLCYFGVGFDHAIQILTEYMALPKPNYTPPEFDYKLPEPEADDGPVF